MKKITITEKNFYTKKNIKKSIIQTEAVTLKDLLKELKYYIKDFIILDENNNIFISENNLITEGMQIVIINADGQMNN